MRVLKTLAQTTVLGCAVSMIPAAAFAGGWSTEGIADYDLLFADGKFVFETQATYADRNVDFKNAKTTSVPILGPTTVDDDKSSAKDIAPNIAVFSGAVKIGLLENLDLFARINSPYLIREQPGFDWNGRFAIGETNADALGVDAMLSYKHELSKGNFVRVFGGVRSVTVDYEQLSKTDATLLTLGILDTDINVESEREYGFRIGAAFEKPEIALRALVAYESAIDLELDGALNIQQLGSYDARAKARLPQSIEAKIQTGIAPKWLATLGVKWTDWSVLNELAVDVDAPVAGLPLAAVPGKVVRDLGYSDGWIVEAGVGHQLTDKLSVGSSVTWDKGIGGPYSDTYSLSLGGSYDFAKNVKFTLGGRAIYKTSGEGVYEIDKSALAGDSSVRTEYEYDSSWNFAVSSKIRVAF
ncbi:Outer membrane protein transport protein (OMPP1/FadL/TodX) [Pseudovibrio sp. W64]|uniref:OmpP1/FadL family transporter n=1 Tax=unclassified Pseudovibrio TaxID=2627060 RepID=UPI0007AE7533|nr:MULTISPECIES: outer membrane protein transport protein [unclassified Pseudovibrio]KZK80538.1 Outer membrane protein transport protein (OMPP1/FadL/TodX) [Pseudovibrio sp. Ad13]KZK89901.1 Outer membrane protein transport protein (OMPP1/FadL/TodX) [Pseudovibrio sp. W64]